MGGWSVDGYCAEYGYEEGTDCHVLEVWPQGYYDTEGGRDDEDICYQFAELEFAKLIKEVSVEHLHFSQHRQMFEIGWKEDGQHLELRVHIVPVEVECE
jgi:transcriptional regulator